ncbi:phosphate ABC transporter permease subunit PstC [Candidatus Saganbacteria bacterium]|nr:phosphate ABC transporter permease subunit PstC [Candidatus Saganbacteria bacterium]
MGIAINKAGNGDKIFSYITLIFAWSIPALLFSLFLSLMVSGWPAILNNGPGFFVRSVWDPVAENFGVLPFIYGTIISSLIALVIAVPLGLGTAIYLTEISRGKTGDWIAQMVELLAAIPSVVYGLWGIFVLGPIVANIIGPMFSGTLGFIPIFSGPVYGLGMFSGGVILAIMILPTLVAVSREVLMTVPNNLRESAMALGTTKMETVTLAVLKPAWPGIMGAIILGLGRALGETMAVTMVIGNRPQISPSIFAPAYTLASVIANEFTEASSHVYLSTLIEVGLVLLLITVIVNGIARMLVWKMKQI